MRKVTLELVVGWFVIAALVLFTYFAIRIGRREALGGRAYELSALFANVGNLKKGSSVLIAGVPVGRVRDVTLEDYQANVSIAILEDTKVQEDAIASVKTRGLLGDTFIEIAPGGSDVVLKQGERIRETEPAIDFYSLVSKYVFSQKSGGTQQ